MNYQSKVPPHVLERLLSHPFLYVSDELGQVGQLSRDEVRNTFTRAVHQWLPKVDVVYVSPRNIVQVRLRSEHLQAKRAYHFARTDWYTPSSPQLAVIVLDSKTRWGHVNNPNLWNGFFSWTGYKPRTYNLYNHFLHELGHALLGIDHVDDPLSIMYERPNEYSPTESLIDVNYTTLPHVDVTARNSFLSTYHDAERLR